MRAFGWARGLAIALAALTLAFCDPAYHGAWPEAMPAQPLVLAPRVCATGIVPLNRRFLVIDFTKLGVLKGGHRWYYAFYATHWADRHGRMDRGFPIFFYLQKPGDLKARALGGRCAGTWPANGRGPPAGAAYPGSIVQRRPIWACR